MVFPSVVDLKGAIPSDKRIVLVGGCFDLIHVGHLHLLEFAAFLGELVVVAVLSDEYVRGYKGLSRPIIPQDQRARMVKSIRCVDFVYVSDESSSGVKTLTLLQPHSVVFCEETDETEKMRKRKENISRVSPHTTVHLLPRYAEVDVSTGSIINKIMKTCY